MTAYGWDKAYCQPGNASLVSDKVEVRCFQIGTGLPVDATFYLTVVRNSARLAFAYANQPAKPRYSPSAAASWNPAGTMNVVRNSVGQYYVAFSGFGAQLPPNVGGQVQVNAIGTGNAHCKVEEWGATSELGAWANQPTALTYEPHRTYSWNPSGDHVGINRRGVGVYSVRWTLASVLYGWGSAQVTAYGTDAAQCNVHPQMDAETVFVLCWAPDGSLVDARYTVLFHS